MKIRRELDSTADGMTTILTCEYCGETQVTLIHYSSDADSMFYLKHLHCAIENLGGLLSRQTESSSKEVQVAYTVEASSVLEKAPLKQVRRSRKVD